MAEKVETMKVRYKDSSPLDAVTVKDQVTGFGDVTFERGKTVELPRAEWVLRLVRHASILSPAGKQGWTDEDRAECFFEEVA